MKKNIFILCFLLTYTLSSFSQSVLNNFTKGSNIKSVKLWQNKNYKLPNIKHKTSSKLKSSLVSNWYDYAYMTYDENKSLVIPEILFPDTNIIIAYDNLTARPWIHSIAVLMDPSSSYFSGYDTNQINLSTPYTLDSIGFYYVYKRDSKTVSPDKIIIDVWKIPDLQALTENDILSFTRDSKDIVTINVPWDSTNLYKSQVKLPGVKNITKITYEVSLTNADTSGDNLAYKKIKISNMSIPAGGLVGCAIAFKPGYTYNANDSINNFNYFQFISIKGDANNYNNYISDDFNCSYVMTPEVRYGYFNNYLPSYFFSSDEYYSHFYNDKKAYPYENHLIEFLLSANIVQNPTPKIQVISPNGGETIKSGEKYSIKWTSSNVANVKIEYQTSTNGTWKTITTSTAASTGLYQWTPNETVASNNCRIRITDLNTSTSDLSDGTFSIVVPKLDLITPVSGEYAVGSNIIIAWESNYVDNVKIEYQYSNGPWYVITTSTPASSNQYTWTAPSQQSTSYKIRISDASNPDLNVIGGEFSILLPALQIISPSAGEKWITGSSHNITWNATVVDTVKIEYQTSSTGTWKVISNAYPANIGTYLWKVPAEANSTDCSLKITDIKRANVASSIPFEIKNALILVTKPNGGEKFVMGYPTNIQWISTDVAKVKIEYQLEPGNDNWYLIASNVSSTANSGQYLWTIPTVKNSNSCRIKISDMNSFASDISDTTFSIGTVGIENLSFNKNYQIYPNPATNTLNVRYYAQTVTHLAIEIIDYTGKIVLNNEETIKGGNFSKQLDISKFSNGIYFIKIIDNENIRLEKLIINK